MTLSLIPWQKAAEEILWAAEDDFTYDYRHARSPNGAYCPRAFRLGVSLLSAGRDTFAHGPSAHLPSPCQAKIREAEATGALFAAIHATCCLLYISSPAPALLRWSLVEQKRVPCRTKQAASRAAGHAGYDVAGPCHDGRCALQPSTHCSPRLISCIGHMREANANA